MKLVAPVVSALLLSVTAAAYGDDVAPNLLDDEIVDDASAELAEVVSSLDASEQQRVRGIYIALERSQVDVTALAACDDDGDYVVVLSRGLLDQVEAVAYADASDRVRGTHLLGGYGALLARAQRADAQVLPPPVSLEGADARARAGEVARAFAQDALAWLVADEVAHAISGELTCPSPTVTHEQADDLWTPEEHALALTLAPSRMAHLDAADAWATRRLLARGGSEVPAFELLRAMASLEDARPPGAATTYLTLHPHARGRAAAMRAAAQAWRDADRAARKSPTERAPMR